MKSMVKRSIFVAALLVAILLSGCFGGGSTTPDTYKLTVTVKNHANEEPLSGAKVEVVGKGLSAKFTDSEGVAVLSGLSGKVEIQVSLGNFITENDEVTMNKDKSETIYLKLNENTAPINDEAGLQAALADPEISALYLEQDLALDQADTLRIDRPLSLNLNGKTLKGNLEYIFDSEENVELSGNGIIEGNLLVKAPQATVHNRIKVTGDITIEELASSTWHEYYHDNSIVVAVSGLEINLHQGARRIVINEPENSINILSDFVSELVANAAVTVSGAERIEMAIVNAPGVVFDRSPQALDGEEDPEILEPDPEPTTPGSLKGDMLHAGTEHPVMDIVTIILNGVNGQIEREAYNGKYKIPNLEAGIYQLQVHSELFEEYTATVSIQNEVETEHDIILQRIDIEPSQVLIPLTLVPGAQEFPAGINSTPCTDVNYAYYLGTYQVTAELWETVYEWATHNYRGEEKYAFRNQGNGGHANELNLNQPVVSINWRDAMVWCNALTEYYNVAYEADLACVYTYDGDIIRDATDANAAVCDQAVARNVDGFRLPTSMEWELAARYIDGNEWNPPTHASGDTDGPAEGLIPGIPQTGSTVVGDYAWYWSNSGGWTHPVGEKKPNHLGIYDMSGNVFEWCFDWHEEAVVPQRIARGGTYDGTFSALWLAAGMRGSFAPDTAADYIGFRLAKSQ